MDKNQGPVVGSYNFIKNKALFNALLFIETKLPVHALEFAGKLTNND